jgi:hypothetical protein
VIPPTGTNIEVDDDSGDEYEQQATDACTVPREETYGKLVSDLRWKFEENEVGDVPFTNSKPMYQGKTKLRPGVGDSWQTPFECFQSMGCDRVFVALLAQHLNDYAKTVLLKDNPLQKLSGLKWKDIMTAEMYRFLGIMLKISLAPIDGGGYKAYFRKEDMLIKYCEHMPHNNKLSILLALLTGT